MVYGRDVAGRTLELEASGALKDSALVMRDRETDSWWSLMASRAIGGPLEGTELPELPVGEKTTWGDWVSRHPDTLVLSVDGREHVENNPYERYFTSDGTFRGAELDDDRLAPKEPVYTFEHDGTPYAVAHSRIEGGAILDLRGRTAFFHRPEGASVFASSDAWLLPVDGVGAGANPETLLKRLEAGRVAGAERLPGFDTFWYTWVAQHEDTELLR